MLSIAEWTDRALALSSPMKLTSSASFSPSIRISLRLKIHQAQAKNFCRVLDIRVPQIMKSDTLAVCPLQYRLKPPSRHAGCDRSVRLHRGRKHPAGVHLFAVFPQHGQHRRRQHQLSDRCLGFGRDDLQFAVYRVRLLVDGQHAGFKVQIPPLKRYQFTPPQAGAEIQQEQFVVPVRLRLNEKFLQFLPIQHLHLLCLFRRQFAADGGVCTEQVIPRGPFQGGAADRVAHPHHAVGKARAACP